MAIVNGNFRPGVWLIGPSSELLIFGSNPVVVDTLETDVVHWLHNRADAVVISEPRKSLSGTVTGELVGDTRLNPGQSAQDAAATYRNLVTVNRNTCRLVWGVHDIPVKIVNPSEPVEQSTRELVFDVSFRFVER